MKSACIPSAAGTGRRKVMGWSIVSRRRRTRSEACEGIPLR